METATKTAASHREAKRKHMLPAVLVRGHQGMHGDASRSPHAYHVIAAVDASTGARIEDAEVEALVTPRRRASEARALEPMQIAGAVTYGNYFTMGGSDPIGSRFRSVRRAAASPVKSNSRISTEPGDWEAGFVMISL